MFPRIARRFSRIPFETQFGHMCNVTTMYLLFNSKAALWQGADKTHWMSRGACVGCGMTALHDMTAGELLANYKTKKLSPVEAVDAVIGHIEKWEPRLKALYSPDFEGARKAAKASEKRWQAGRP